MRTRGNVFTHLLSQSQQQLTTNLCFEALAIETSSPQLHKSPGIAVQLWRAELAQPGALVRAVAPSPTGHWLGLDFCMVICLPVTLPGSSCLGEREAFRKDVCNSKLMPAEGARGPRSSANHSLFLPGRIQANNTGLAWFQLAGQYFCKHE